MVVETSSDVKRWTAVVRGAAIFGIENSNNGAVTAMSACAQSYGVSVNVPFSEVAHNPSDRIMDSLSGSVIAKDQLIWLIKKGDLILSDQPREATATFTKYVTKTGDRTGYIPIFAYDAEMYEAPDRLASALAGSLIFFQTAQ
jgi:hypothetical protein